jgi:hypothetical protein
MSFITEKFLKEGTPISSNVDVKDLVPHIESAEEAFTTILLGELLFNDLKLKLNEQTLTLIEIEAVNLIKKSVAWRTVYMALPFISNKITGKGVVQQRGDYSQQSSLGELKYLRQESANRAELSERNIIDFLNKNKTEFPLWKGNNCSNNNNSPFDSDLAFY